MPLATLERRQLWNIPTSTSSYSVDPDCTPFTLPANGLIALNDNTTITLSSNVVFTPQCTGASNSYTPDDPSSVADLQAPFYASSTPQIYAIAAATVIAWMLVVMLVITPRTFFIGGPGSGSSFLSRHGIISGAAGWTTGGATVVGVGSRPWLQKIAALTVAVSLTIATIDTFEVAKKQYDMGYMDAAHMRSEVLDSLEIRITRVISGLFVWLAQVQTLIRLFPRHKEKVMIKWVGFGLIFTDVIFSCLKNFWIHGGSRPGRFVDALPALDYLFALALSLLYAILVLYYALSKARYAFYHPNMKNICVVAFLSMISVLVPSVFFVTDLARPDAAGWGRYFIWVGSAAASVVVWEWVERIEALEREEQKYGILGREVFDGDEMLDVTPSQEDAKRGSRGFGGAFSSAAGGRGFQRIAKRLTRSRKLQSKPRPHIPLGRMEANDAQEQEQQNSSPGTVTRFPNVRTSPALPPAVVTLPSRADTASAASTVYAVRYHTVSESVGGQQGNAITGPNNGQDQTQRFEANPLDDMAVRASESSSEAKEKVIEQEPVKAPGRSRLTWQGVARSFGRRRVASPAEVHNARKLSMSEPPEPQQQRQQPAHAYSKWDVKSRLGALAAEQGERFRERNRGRRTEMQLPITIIPAQPRGRTWSPQILESEQAATIPRPAFPQGNNCANAGHYDTSNWQSPETARSPEENLHGDETIPGTNPQSSSNSQSVMYRGSLRSADSPPRRRVIPYTPFPRSGDAVG